MQKKCLAVLCLGLINAHAVTFTPTQTTDNLNNPHKGFMLWGTTALVDGGPPANHYGARIFHVYAPWRELETADQVFDFAGFESRHFTPILNVYPDATFVIRILADYPNGVGSNIHAHYTGGQLERDYPLFLEQAPLNIVGTDYASCDGDGPGRAPNWNDPNFISQTEQLIDALDARYDGDPRITAIQTGLLGLWGEWHQSGCESLAPGTAVKVAVRNRYASRFTQTPLQSRYARNPDVLGVNFGFYEDYFPSFTANCIYGFPLCSDDGDWNLEYGFANVVPAARTNWLSNPVSGESPLTSQKSTWVNDTSDVLTVLRNYHFSFLGPAGKHEQAGFESALNTIKRTLGYNLHLDSLTWPNVANSPGEVAVSVTLSNDGSAPVYHAYQLKLGLANNSGVLVWSSALNASLKQVLPAQPSVINESITLPANISTGTYTLLAYIESTSANRPPIILQSGPRDTQQRVILGSVQINAGTIVNPIFNNGFE